MTPDESQRPKSKSPGRRLAIASVAALSTLSLSWWFFDVIDDRILRLCGDIQCSGVDFELAVPLMLLAALGAASLTTWIIDHRE